MSSPVVTLEQGQLCGSRATDYKGQEFLQFQGIPYAKPPIGELRFKAPQLPEKWPGVFDATKEGSACYSRHILKPDVIVGSENCLVLNVYTSKIIDKLRPVMFWIHGGGLINGSSTTELYGPEFLVNEEVVLVTINYRLGMLGFLSLEDPALGVPGNAGLKDMVMALKWVQKNISKFGGDPGNVTIFGESAGGAAVQLLILSPMGKGLFHKGIMQSGSVLNPWAQPSTQHGDVAHVAKLLNLKTLDEQTIYKQLIKLPVEEILKIQEKIPYEGYYPSLVRPFGITIEKASHEAFLSENPLTLIQQGKFNKVPLIAGYTSAEGMCFEHLKRNPKSLRPTIEDCIPWQFGYKLGTPESKAAEEKIKKFYYGSEEPSPANIGKKYDILTDTAILYGLHFSVTNHFRSSQNPIYVYRFSLDTELNFLKIFMGITVPGANHLDDVAYLFKNFSTPVIKKGSKEEIGLRRVLKLWTNFAKFGNPTPKVDDLLNVEWKPLTDANNITALDISDDLKIVLNPEQDRINFWQTLYANGPNGKAHMQ